MPRTPFAESKRAVRHATRLRAAGRAIAVGVVALLAGVASLPAALAAVARVELVPSSIKADCSVDVSSPLTSWLATVPNGSTVRFAPGGCYRTDTRVVLEHKSNVVVDGAGATLQRVTPTPAALLYPNHNSHFEVAYSSNITVRDLHVVGLNTVSDSDRGFQPGAFGSGGLSHSFEAAYEFFGVDGLTLNNLTADGVYGDGVTLGGESAATAVSRVTGSNITIDRTGRQGISLVSAHSVVLDHISLLHAHASGFDLEPNGATASVSGVEIHDSYINARDVAFQADGARDVSGINIHDNTIVYSVPSHPWVEVGDTSTQPVRSDWTVTHNTVDNARRTSSIKFVKVNNIDVEANISPVVGYAGVSLVGDGGTITITGNDFKGATQPVGASSGTTTVIATANHTT